MIMISIVIPIRNDIKAIDALFLAITKQTLLPEQVVLVDSSEDITPPSERLKALLADRNINLDYIQLSGQMMPGAARNLGVSRASGDLIAFLDAKTIPGNDWLKQCTAVMESTGAQIVWGSIIYSANGAFKELLIHATYGPSALYTLPGSLIKKSVFRLTGGFIGRIRAGEDTDWMLRARLHGVRVAIVNKSTLTYIGLQDISYLSILKKWHRNYRVSIELPHLIEHRLIYFATFFLSVLFIALNWNSFFTNWNTNNILYIPNITKFTLLCFFVIYILVRGFYLPLKKGGLLKYLLPFRWILIALISIPLDFSKISAFLFIVPAYIRSRIYKSN